MARPAVCEVPRQAGLGSVHVEAVKLLQGRVELPVPHRARAGVPGEPLQKLRQGWLRRWDGEAEEAQALDQGPLELYTVKPFKSCDKHLGGPRQSL